MNQEKKQKPFPLPTVHVVGALWDLYYGEHPSLAKGNRELFGFSPLLEDKASIEHLDEFFLPLYPCISGHNIIQDATFASKLGIDIKVPLSPLFARDLAGRTIYLGYGPEEKEDKDWPSNPRALFPKNCMEVTPEIEGADFIENVFFTRFRTLDMGEYYEISESQLGDGFPDFYWGANLYPYKLRLDTFYQDGWRLPQTEMLFVKPGQDASAAKKAGEELLKKWEEHPKEESYEKFMGALIEEDLMEELYEKGCTLIPTLEAFNGCYKVDGEYEILDMWGGKAVEAFHEVVEEVSDSAPKGTIVKVLSPGFATEKHIHKAQVTVSGGKTYAEKLKHTPKALLPDLRLPHQRTCSNWGTTWLPTHPEHFTEPAIFGWDEQTGRFLQLTGPLWDPIHYHYECLGEVIKAFKAPLENSKDLAEVPKKMKTRFYPITPMKGFDIPSKKTKAWRKAENIRPTSGIRRVTSNHETCDVGYHPLPLQFEYEMDGFWFAESLSPKHRVSAPPAEVKDNLSEVIHPQVSAQEYLDAIVEAREGENEYAGALHPQRVQEPVKDALQNFPHLKRYQKKSVEEEAVVRTAPAYLEEAPYGLQESSLELWGGSVADITEATGIPFYAALDEFRKKALKWAKERNKLYTESLEEYKKRFWG